MPSPELEEISRVRTLATWLKSTGKPAETYPKRHRLSEREIEDAKRFACGIYPWPSKWTIRLYHLAKDG